MCKIFDWVFDSITVEEAPQNHFEDPNQDEDEGFDQVFNSIEDRDRSTLERMEHILEDAMSQMSIRINRINSGPVSEITEKISRVFFPVEFTRITPFVVNFYSK